MTQQQIDLLKRLIDADRQYRMGVHSGDFYSENDHRWVEVGWINGVNPRTAKSLVDAGLPG